MALPALKSTPEEFVEHRIARLEANVEHMQSDIADIKTDIRDMRQTIKRMDEKLNEVDKRMEKGFARIDYMRMVDRIWQLMTLAALLAVMARAFKWI